jgi:pimeloyl-ACP methyl ester carboxylesterase
MPEGYRALVARRVVLFPPGDPDPAETARRDVELLTVWDKGVAGVAGWSDHGWEAVRLLGEHPEVERLVLLATPVDEDADVPEISAKTLLLFGAADERAGSRAARWWKKQIPHARIEMSPGRGHDLLLPMWPRVLRHLAPGTLR